MSPVTIALNVEIVTDDLDQLRMSQPNGPFKDRLQSEVLHLERLISWLKSHPKDTEIESESDGGLAEDG